MAKARIALAGIATESCTFSPLRTTAADFTRLAGDAAIDSVAGGNFAGGLDDATPVGGLLARALPGGPLTAAAYQELRQQLLAELAGCGRIDGVLLDLHGAMAVDGLDDAEADLLAAIRQAVRPGTPLVAAFDLHGNISRQTVELLDAHSAYRTAPHVDVAQTRSRAAALMQRCLDGWRPARAWRRIPVLLTGEQTSTRFEPGRRVWEMVDRLAGGDGIADASLFVGYAWSDQPRTAACATCHADDQAAADAVADQLAASYAGASGQFGWPVPVLRPQQAFAWASRSAKTPVVLSDAADNPTAGGVGDASAMLDAALASGADSCLIAGIADAPAVAAAAAAGVDSVLSLTVGESLAPGTGRVSAEFRVAALAADDGAGACAVLQTGGVQVVCTQQRRTFHRLADFERLGLQPDQFAIIVVKIGYLEPQLEALAAANCLVNGPGCVPPDISSIRFTNTDARPPAAD